MNYPTKDQLERAKLSLELIVYFVIILVIYFSIFHTNIIREKIEDVFDKSGLNVEEVNFFGVKFKLFSERAGEVRKDIELITAKYVEAVEVINCQKQDNCSTDQLALISNPNRGQDALLQVAEEAKGSLDSVISESEAANQRIDAEHIKVDGTEPSDKWIVIVGADRMLSDALDEVGILTRAGYTNTAVLFVDGWYRTVVNFTSKSDANMAISAIEQAVKRRPYARDYFEWCPYPIDRDTYIECRDSS